MTRTTWMLLVAATGFLLSTEAASAQEPAPSFETLATRVTVGQQIWVTDAKGREVHGRLQRLSTDGLVLRSAGDLETFAASNVRRVRARERDSLKNGTLIGLGIGLGLGTAWCIGAIADDSGDIDARVECAEGLTVFPGIGALAGLGIDALIPGKMRAVFELPRRPNGPRATLGIVPVYSPRMRGVAVSFAF